jgi:SanA protein
MTKPNVARPKRLRWLRRLIGWFLALAVLATVGFIACDWWVSASTSARVRHQLSAVPAAPVALLLGTSPRVAGQPNPFYLARIEAARELFAAGKVRGILVSGDNRHTDYNEPMFMRADLIRAGVPAEFITLDFAGFRTLDSVVRAKAVFQQSRVIIVSQRFHAERALFVAQHIGLDADAYAAADPGWSWQFRVRLREVFARAVACADVGLLRRQPHFLGPAEPVHLKGP